MLQQALNFEVIKLGTGTNQNGNLIGPIKSNSNLNNPNYIPLPPDVIPIQGTDFSKDINENDNINIEKSLNSSQINPINLPNTSNYVEFNSLSIASWVSENIFLILIIISQKCKILISHKKVRDVFSVLFFYTKLFIHQLMQNRM